jgi:hypothetical protein
MDMASLNKTDIRQSVSSRWPGEQIQHSPGGERLRSREINSYRMSNKETSSALCSLVNSTGE